MRSEETERAFQKGGSPMANSVTNKIREAHKGTERKSANYNLRF